MRIGLLSLCLLFSNFNLEILASYNFKTQRSGVIFTSGDVHFGEIARYDCGVQYPLYDITSSGLTRSLEEEGGPLMAYLIRVVFWLVPSTMRIFSPSCRHKSCIYGTNYLRTEGLYALSFSP